MTVDEFLARFPEVPRDLRDESVLERYVVAFGPLLRLAQKPSPCVGAGGGRRGGGEEEPEILPALGRRTPLLPLVHREGDSLDRVARRGLLGAAHPDQPAPAGDRDHHDAGGPPLTLERFQRSAEGVAKDQLLQAQARPESKRARAQPADRPRRDLEHEWAALADAQPGVG